MKRFMQTALVLALTACGGGGDELVTEPCVPLPPTTTQQDAVWHLDRIDQAALPLTHTFTYRYDGTGVYAFVLDTGIRRDHNEFAGRVLPGASFVTNGGQADFGDCYFGGHGTEVAGVLAGINWGVAKRATLVPVVVTNCIGWVSPDAVTAAVDWVIAQRNMRPAVINMSFGGKPDDRIAAAARKALDAGIPVVTAAGNSNENACGMQPGNVAGVINVGASDRTDSRSTRYSNFGPCVDLFAPGDNANTASSIADNAITAVDGTSFATPIVTGLVAQFLQASPHATPAEVKTAILAAATPGALNPATLNASPNLLARDTALGPANVCREAL